MAHLIKKVFRISNKIRIGIINFIFWLIVIIALLAFFNFEEAEPTGSSLFIQFTGDVVESQSSSDILEILSSDDFQVPTDTILKYVISSIYLAANDKKILDIVMDLDYLNYMGLGAMEEIGDALKYFKETGKEIYVFSTFYGREEYYLASFGSEISIDPMGEVDIEGLSVYRNYYKNVLDKYDVDIEVFRAGNYKSYVEPYISDSMSGNVKEQNLLWMNSIWLPYKNKIAVNRGFDQSFINQYFNSRVDLLRSYSGNSSNMALETGLVDYVETRDDFFYYYDDLYYYQDYIVSKNRSSLLKDKIAIIPLEGTISYSDNDADYVSALDFIDSVDNVLYDDSYKGIIVRINSGGGGAFASELIRRKIEEAKEYIPVIISMGDVCASGGYWIASSGDVIYADSNTITGSIGVFGMLYGLENTLKNNFGINSDGVSTTPDLDSPDLTRNITESRAELIQLGVDDTYNKFLNLVSEGRDLELSYLEGIAGGRVWSGKQALEFGLVDEIGGLKDAMDYFDDDSVFEIINRDTSIMGTITNTINSIKSMSNFNQVNELTIIDRINDPKNVYAIWY